MAEPTGQELVERYKRNYGMAGDAVVTETMVLRHWELEQQLRRRLLSSSSESRWDVFEQSYTELYRELPWLNELAGAGAPPLDDDEQYGYWTALIGTAPKLVYEVGSGKAGLITYLATRGYRCKATEITQERGERWDDTASDNLVWGTSDGIHLDEFEPVASYDVVISNQVIEHMHPDDVPTHLRAARRILRDGGRYVLSTPHVFVGPSDVSSVFGAEAPLGMHLREYRYAELRTMLRDAGFGRIVTPLRLPVGLRRVMGARPLVRVSRVYLGYLLQVESLIGKLPHPGQRRTAARVARFLLFPSNVVLIASKDAP